MKTPLNFKKMFISNYTVIAGSIVTSPDSKRCEIILFCSLLMYPKLTASAVTDNYTS